MRRMPLVSLVLLFLLVGPRLSAQTPPFDLRPYQSVDYLILIVARTPREDWLFDFNLDISLHWDRLEARRVAVAEATGAPFNPQAVARQFGMVLERFAVALLRPDGSVLYRTSTVPRVSELLAIIEAGD